LAFGKVGEQKLRQKLNDGLKNKTGIIFFTYLSTWVK